MIGSEDLKISRCRLYSEDGNSNIKWRRNIFFFEGRGEELDIGERNVDGREEVF